MLDTYIHITLITSSTVTKHQHNTMPDETQYFESKSRLCALISITSARPVALSLPHTAWVKLNYLQTGVEKFYSSMYK